MENHRVVIGYFKARIIVDINKRIQLVLNKLGILGDKQLVDEKKVLYEIAKDLGNHFNHLAERFKQEE